MKRFALVAAASLLVILAVPSVGATSKKSTGPSWEYVGQVTNTGPSSAQYGNLINVAGAPTGASFTFYTTAVNVSVTVDGPLRIIDRKGTTTIYEATAPGDFRIPESFRSGTPVQVSALWQQVIVNTTTGTFSVVNFNTVTSVTPIVAGEQDDTLGELGQTFRTVLNGQLNTAGTTPPSGWFSGYATQ